MIVLPDLPYPYDALAPAVSEDTLHFHHDKHHAAYVRTVNELLDKAGKTPRDLESLVIDSAGGSDRKLFNNAAQAWNHGFFWVSMTPDRTEPTGDLHSAIASAFGDLGKLRDAFVAEGATHFGSGWVWLTADRHGALKVISTHDAHDMLTEAQTTPLLVCDVWEHAYYLDYQNDRKGFLEAWFDALPNWSLAAAQLAAARGQGQAWRYPKQSADAGAQHAA
ncbi:MAG: superoxide dismutase [Caulobacteraceae bacterium]